MRRERGARGTSVARVSRFSPSSAANGYFEGRGTGGKALVQQNGSNGHSDCEVEFLY